MPTSIYDLRGFYECRKGRIIQPLLQDRIRSFWPETNNLRVMGCGYATPYLAPYVEQSERVVAMMPEQFGVHAWGPDGVNHAYLSNETELPIETESIDRLLLVHSLEHSAIPDLYLQELWRVLKSTGRILIIAPNRTGLWARAEWSPFGHGTPFSASQLNGALRDNMFVVERSERALYLPPFRSSMLLRFCLPFEKRGWSLTGGMAGVLMIEASKQLYGGLPTRNAAAKIQMRGRRVLVPSTAPGG